MFLCFCYPGIIENVICSACRVSWKYGRRAGGSFGQVFPGGIMFGTLFLECCDISNLKKYVFLCMFVYFPTKTRAKISSRDAQKRHRDLSYETDSAPTAKTLYHPILWGDKPSCGVIHPTKGLSPHLTQRTASGTSGNQVHCDHREIKPIGKSTCTNLEFGYEIWTTTPVPSESSHSHQELPAIALGHRGPVIFCKTGICLKLSTLRPNH